ncbi:hypothetical protein ABLE92_11940 [Gordonia sp. VNQ95]|uniref:hypothetical protein n=1 Tax=Gordonia sp. VNQ95 TaxID=3156619 RepID=UPI0032B3969D
MNTSSFAAIHWDRIWRRRYLVAAIAIVITLVGTVSSLTTATTYSSKATLSVASQTRAPEQDSYLAQGYINFFNDPAYQATLRSIAAVPADVTFVASLAGPSPLIYITATSTDSAQVGPAAGQMATALENTVNDAMRAEQDRSVAAIRKPFDDIRSASGVIPQQSLAQLEDRISQITGDSTNQVTALDLRSEVSTAGGPSLITIALALLAGLVVGAGVALACGIFTRRVDSAHDLHAMTGLESLATVPTSEPAGTRSLQHLAVALDHRADPTTALIALCGTSSDDSTAHAAEVVARTWRRSGLQVAIIDATHGRDDDPTPETFLADDSEDFLALELSDDAPPPAAALRSLLDGAGDRYDRILIILPPITESSDAQVLCSVARDCVLVVDQSRSTNATVGSTVALLRKVDATILGTVFVEHPLPVVGRLPRFGTGGEARATSDTTDDVTPPADDIDTPAADIDTPAADIDTPAADVDAENTDAAESDADAATPDEPDVASHPTWRESRGSDADAHGRSEPAMQSAGTR